MTLKNSRVKLKSTVNTGKTKKKYAFKRYIPKYIF